MTKQEYYDLLVKCAQDGTFPARGNMGCMYRVGGRADAPKRCAVGVLIPDNLYQEEMEGSLMLGNSLACFIEDKGLLPDGLSVSNLIRIQIIHDLNAKYWSAERFIAELNASGLFADIHTQPPSIAGEAT